MCFDMSLIGRADNMHSNKSRSFWIFRPNRVNYLFIIVVGVFVCWCVCVLGKVWMIMMQSS